MTDRRRVVAIIQARMGSTRLPGKALMPIGERPMLDWVLRRAGRARHIDSVVVATTVDSQDNVIAEFCQKTGYPFFRGSEQDVLDRYWKAANENGAEVVVRITSDCPLIDPDVIDLTIDGFTSAPDIDYAANTIEPRTYPRGLDVEVFSGTALRRAWHEDVQPESREHVTPYLYRMPGRFRTFRVADSEDHSNHRWTVDTPEDLAFARAVYREFPEGDFGYREVFAFLDSHPEIRSLNSGIKQKAIPFHQ